MDNLRIQPLDDTQINLDITCKCGKVLHLSSVDGDQPSFCGSCEKAYFLKSHSGHFHLQSKVISRGEILQYSYGKIAN